MDLINGILSLIMLGIYCLVIIVIGWLLGSLFELILIRLVPSISQQQPGLSGAIGLGLAILVMAVFGVSLLRRK